MSALAAIRRRLAGSDRALAVCGRASAVAGAEGGFRVLPEKRRGHGAVPAPTVAVALRRLALGALGGCDRAPAVAGAEGGFRALPEKRRGHGALPASTVAGSHRRVALGVCGRAPAVSGAEGGFRTLPEKRRDHGAVPAPTVVGSLRRVALAGCVLLSLVGLWPVAAQAQDVVTYISNAFGRQLGDRSIWKSVSLAQPFRTGSRSDRYSLQEVVIRLQMAGSGTPKVTIREDSQVSESRCHVPGTIRYTLTNPDSLRSGLNTFTAPAEATLEPDTCYHIVAESNAPNTGVSQDWYMSDDLSNDDGWSTKDYLHKIGTAPWRTENRDRSFMVRIRGPVEPEVTVTAEADQLNEGADARFTVRRTGVTTGALTVNYSVSETGDVVAPGEEEPKTVDFADGQTEVTVTVPTVNDSGDEPNSEVTLMLDRGATYYRGESQSATVTVRDDDEPLLTFVSNLNNPRSNFHGHGAVILVSLTKTLSQSFRTGSAAGGYALDGIALRFRELTSAQRGTLTATLRANDPNDKPGNVLHTLRNPSPVDYDGINEFTTRSNVVLAAGTRYHVVLDWNERIGGPSWLRAADEDLDPGTAAGWEIGNRHESTDRGASWGGSRSSRLLIGVRGREVPLPRVSVEPVASPVAEGEGAQFRVTRTRNTRGALTVSYSVSETGDMVAPDDEGAKTVDFGNGESEKTVTVPTVEDEDHEADSTVTLTLTADAAYELGTDATAEVTVENDDAPPPPQVTLTLTPASITEDGGTSTVTASLDRMSSQDTIVTVSAAPVSPATEGDYTLSVNRELTIAAGATDSTGEVTITAVDNDVSAPDKEVTVSATASNTEGVTDPDPVTLTITNDDVSELSIADASVDEGDSGSTTTLDFTVTLDPAATETVTVDWATSDGTAEAGTDYTAGNGTLTFDAGDSSRTVSVTVAGDNVDEPDETFTVTLSGESGAILGDGTATGTITDDDDPPTVTLTLTPDTIAEAGGVSTVAATLDHPSSESTTVTVTLTPESPAVAGDYTLSGSRLTIPAGATTSTDTVTITAVDNDVDAPHKTVTVSATAENTQGVTDPQDVTLTVIDDENVAPTGAPTIDDTTPVVGETLTADESGIVDSDGLAGATFTWRWLRVAAGGAVTEVGTGESYTVVDADVGSTLKVEVTFTDEGGAQETVESEATAAAEAPPIPTVSVEPVASPVAEGADAQFTVTRTVVTTGALTVAYRVSETGDMVASGEEGAKTVAFGDGESEKTVTVPTVGDTDHEADSTVTVTLTADAAWDLETATADVTVEDDDDSPATGSVTVTGTATEGETLNADTSGLTDADGLASAAYVYQWVRTPSGGSDEDISGATSQTYVPVFADAGATLKVRVTVTDDEGHEAEFTSAPTSAVAALPRPEVTVTSDGDVTEGSPALFTLTRTGDTAQTLDVAWEVTATGDFGVTTGAGTATFLANDATVQVSVDTTGDDTHEAHGSVTLTLTADTGADPAWLLGDPSTATAAVRDDDDSPATGTVTVTTATTFTEGETLTADTSGITDGDGLDAAGYVYQWVRTPSGGGDEDISGATGATYVPVYADAGATLKVRVTVTDDEGHEATFESAPTSAVAAASRPSVTVASDGDVTEGSAAEFTLTRTGDTAQTLDVAYDVTATGDFGVTTGAATATFLANSATVQVSVDTTGDNTHEAHGSVTVTLTADTGDDPAYLLGAPSTATAAVEDDDDSPATGTVTVTGTATEGETLTADTSGLTDEDGLADTDYQWVRTPSGGGDEDISGATSKTYVPVFADAGATLKVRVTVTDDEGHEATFESVPTSAVAAASRPSVTVVSDGDVTEGETVTFTLTRTGDPAQTLDVAYGVAATGDFGVTTGAGTATFPANSATVQVSVDTTGDGAHEAHGSVTLTLTADTGVDPAYLLGAPSTATAAVEDDDDSPASGTVTVTTATTFTEGETLTADTSGLTDGDGLADADYAYQWVRTPSGGSDEDISGATSKTYVPVFADAGATLKVRVTVTDDEGHEATFESAPTSAVAAASRPSVTVASDGDVTEGSPAVFTLTRTGATAQTLDVAYEVATTGDFGAAAGAATATFLANSPTVQVSVDTTDDSTHEAHGSVTLTLTADTSANPAYLRGDPSTATATVRDDDDSPTTGSVTVTGTPTEGETLTADTSGLTDADGLADTAYAWQWMRTPSGGSDEDISGATSQTYVPVFADAGATLKVKVTVTDDEGHEATFTSAPTSAVAALPRPSVTVASDGDVTEGSAAVFTLTRTGDTAQTLDVDYEVTATGNFGVTTGAGTAMFLANNATVQVSVATTGDTTDEADGSVTLTLQANPVAYALGTDAAATATVEDDDEAPPPPMVGTLVSNAAKPGSGNVRLILDHVAQPFTTGGASNGYDLHSVVVEIRFPGSDVEVTIRESNARGDPAGTLYTLVNPPSRVDESDWYEYRAPANATLEADTTYHVVARRVTGGTKTWRFTRTSGVDPGSASGWQINRRYLLRTSGVGNWANAPGSASYCKIQVRGTESASEPLPTVAVEPIASPVEEGEDAQFRVTRTEDTAGALTVNYGVSETGGDMVASGEEGAKSVDFADGESEKTVTVPTTEDTVHEADSVVTLTLTADAAYDLGTDATADVTVEDDDNAPPTGKPTIDDTTPVRGQTLTAEASGVGDPDGLTNRSFTWQWVRVSGGTGTPIAGATSETYTVVAGDVGATLKVEVTFTDNDGTEETIESEETAAVELPAAVTPSSDGDVTEGEPAVFTLTRTGSTAGTLRVKFDIDPSGGDFGLAAEDDGTTTFPVGSRIEDEATFEAGSSTTQVRLSTVDDNTHQADGTVFLTVLLSEDEFYALGDVDFAELKIRDNDNAAPTGAPTIDDTTPVVGEMLTADPSGIGDPDGLTGATYAWRWLRVASGGGETEVGTGATYTVVAGDVGATLKVEAAFTDDDGTDETVESAATATVEAAPMPTVSVAPVSSSVAEGADAQFTVMRTVVTTGALTVRYGVSESGAMVASGEEGAKTVAFGDGDTEQTVTVPTVEDSAHEADSTVTVTLTADAAYRFGANRIADVTVEDDDNAAPAGAPTIDDTTPVVGQTLTADESGITDADGLTGATYAWRWIRVASGGGETEVGTGASYTVVDGDVGSTLKVEASFTDDDGTDEAVESAETMTVEAAPVLPALSIADASVDEGDSGSTTLDFTVTLDRAATETVTVDWATSDGTATAGTDYTAGTGTLTFNSGDSSKTVSVTVAGDNVDEPNETFTVTLSGESGATIEDGAATGTITDDDATPTVTLVLTPDSITEDGGVSTVTATLDHPSSESTTVTVTAAPVSPAVAGDYTLSGSRLTIAAGATESTGEVTITAVDNAVDAPHKTVTVSATAENTQGVTAPQDVTLTVTDDENVAPTGAPTIDDTTPVVGETLTADESGIVDSDGLAGATFTWRWIRVASGGGETEVGTGTSYTVVAADVGSTLKVVASFTDDDGTAETVESAATGVVEAAPIPTVSVARVSTPVAEGEDAQFTVTRTVVTTGALTVNYRVSETGAMVASGEEGAKTVAFADGDTEKTVTVPTVDDSVHESDSTVTLTLTANAAYALGTATATVTVEDDDNADPTGAPTIDDTTPVVGETLTADTSGIDDPDGLTNPGFTWQWIRTSGGTVTRISGATAATYAVVAADVDATLKVEVTFTDDDDTTETLMSAATSAVKTSIVWVTSEGDVTEGDPAVWTLRRTGSATGMLSVKIGIRPSGGDFLVAEGGTTFPLDMTTEDETTFPAGSSTTQVSLSTADDSTHEADGTVSLFVMEPDDGSYSLGEPDEGQPEFAVLKIRDNDNAAPTGTVTIDDTTPMVGETLTADASGIRDPDGLTGATFTWQWIRVSGSTETRISGATSETYTVVAGDVGSTLKVEATFTDDDGTAETVESAETATVEALPEVTVASDGDVTEGSAAVFTLTRTGDTARTLDVDYEVTATGDFGVTTGAGTATFLANNSTVRVSLATTGDGVHEAHGSVTLTLQADAAYALGADAAATATILDDDDSPATGSVTVTGTATEGQTLTADTSAIADADGLANASYAYRWVRTPAGGGNADISGATSQTYVPVFADVGATLKVRVTVTDDEGHRATFTSASTSAVTALPRPEVTVASDGDVTEGSPALFTLTRTGDTAQTLDVAWEVTATGDFGVTPGAGTATFPANSATVQVSVATTGDTTDEADGSVTLTLQANPVAYALGTDASATVTVEDDDEAPLPVVTVAPRKSPVSEGDPAAEFVVTRTGDTTGALRVRLSVSETGDMVSAGNEGGQTRTIPAGQSSVVISVPTVDDGVHEADSVVTVTLEANAAYELGTDSTAEVTVEDDDDLPVVSVAPVSSPVVESEDAQFTVTRTGVTTGALTVRYNVVETGAMVRSGDKGAQTVSFSGDMASVTVTVPTVFDNLHERNSRVTVTLTADAAYELGTDATARVLVKDDDDSPATGTVTVTGTAREGETLTADTSGIADEDGGLDTAAYVYQWVRTPSGGGDEDISGATSETYVPVSADAGATLKVRVTVTDDEGHEATFTSAPTSAVAALPALSIGDASVDEGDSGSATLDFTVTLDSAATETVTVDWATSDGTATAGTDYTAGNGTVTFNAGDSSKTVSVTVAGDNVDEPNETFTVTLSNPSSSATIGDGTATGTITDDDATPTVTLVLSLSSITEVNQQSTVTATLDHPSSEATTVTVSVSPVSPAVAGDYTLSTNRVLTIAAGATTSTGTVTVTSVNNTVDAPHKTVTVSGTATNSQGVTDPDDVTLTIRDNDATPTVTLVLTPDSITEVNEQSTVTATLNHPSSEATTVTVSVSPVSPAVAGDYTLSTNRELTIPAGSTTSTGTVTVTSVNNTVDAPHKTVTVSATATNDQGVTAPDAVTLTIRDNDATPTVTLVLTPASIPEAGGTSTVTATLNHPSSAETTVTVSASPVSPAVAGDYTLSGNLDLTIAAGQTTSTGTVTITAVDNDVVAAAKEVTVSATATNGQGVTAPDDVTLTITDDDEPGLSIADASVDEGDSGASATLTFTVTLNPAALSQVTVDWATADGTARAGTDYTAGNGSLTFNAGDSSKTVTVTVTGDDVDEPDETFTMTLSSASGADISDGTATGTIRDDDDEPTVTLVLSSNSITEVDQQSTVTATLDHASSEETTVTVSVAPVSPAVAGDYRLSTNRELTIAAGATTSTGTVTITSVNNTVDAPHKTVTVSGAATNSQGVTDPDSVTLTIRDNDATPTVTLVLSSNSITEAGGTSTVTATLNHASSEETTVTVSVAPVSPAVSGDYTLSANRELTIAAGATTSTGTVTVTGVDNTADAPDKTVTVSGTATNSQGVTGPAPVTLTIEDNDGPPTVTLVLSPASITEANEQSTVTATLDRVSGAETTVTVSVSPDSPAVAGDYRLSANRELTIPAGQTTSTGTVTVTSVNNTVDAPHKTVTVSATATNAQGVTAPNSVTLTIRDNDATPTVTLVLSPDSITEGNEQSTVTATLDHPSSEATTVTVSVAPDSPAVAGDYTLSSNRVLTIAAGATTSTGTVTVTSVNNVVDAPHKTVTVSATATNAQGVTVPDAVTLTIRDNDATPTVTLVLTPASIPEAGGTSTVTARLNHRSSEATTVTVSVSPVSPAVMADYMLSSNRVLTIAAGATTSTGTVTITAVDNDVVAAAKEVTVSATATNGQGVTAPDDVTLTIREDDVPGLSVADASVAEGDSGGTTMTFTVMLNPVAVSPVTVDWATADGTARAGTDYTAGNGSLTFNAGDSSKTVSVTVTGDDVDEPNETFTVTLSNASGATIGDGTATGTIRDDDAEPTVTLVLTPASIDENGGTSTVTATLDRPSSEATTVTVSVAPVSPAVAGDYTLSTNRVLTIAAGSTTSTGTVTVTSVNNTVDAPHRTVTVSGTATNSQGVTDPDPVTLTIRDNDATPTVTLVLTPASIPEAGSEADRTSTVTATLDHPSSEATTVTVSAAPVDPAVSGDYTLSGSQLTIAAGQTDSTGTVTITAVDNDADARHKTVTVSGAATNSQGVTAPAPVTLTITNDDKATIELSVSLDTIVSPGTMSLGTGETPVTVSEGAGETEVTVTATVTGTTPLGEERTVTVSVTSGQDGAVDFAEVEDFPIVIPAGPPGTSASETFVLVPENDDVAGADTILRVSGSVDGVDSVIVNQPMLVLTDNDEAPVEDEVADEREHRLEYALASFGRTVVQDLVTAVEDRRWAASAGTTATLAGTRLPLSEEAVYEVLRRHTDPDGDLVAGTDALRELLSRSSFQLALGGEGEAGGTGTDSVVLWGRGSQSWSAGRLDSGVGTEGEVLSGQLGVEFRPREDTLLGVMLSGSAGEVEFEGEFDTEVETELVGVHPYAQWSPREGLRTWAMLGYGAGEATLTDDYLALAGTDIEMMMAAGGGSHEVASRWGIDWSLGTNGFFVQLDADEVRFDAEGQAALVPAVKSEVWQMRLLLEGSAGEDFGGVEGLRGNVELAARVDGGDAESGMGMEVGGGVGYERADLGLEVEASGRMLLTHEEEGLEDAGVSLSLEFDPGARGRGVYFALAPSWGNAVSGARSMWEDRQPTVGGSGGGDRFEPQMRLSSELGYTTPTPLRRGTLTTYGAFSSAGGTSRQYRVGRRLELGIASMSLEAERHESSGATPEHGIWLRGNLRF